MKSSLVSVIIPAYNHERFVGPAIESVLQQSHANIELIVVDDGSTDATARVIRSYADPRLRYVYEENQDAYNALNNGLALARGEFVAILNSDDIFARTRLECLLAAQEESGAQCLFTRVRLIDDDGRELADPELWWNRWYEDGLRRFTDCGDLYTTFLQRNILVTTSNLFLTRAAVQRVGQFCPLRYLHDYDYMFRALLALPGQVRFLHDAPLLCYRIHQSNTISEAAISGREQDQAVIRKYLLARMPEELRPLVDAGTGRLVELERELLQERLRRDGAPLPGIRVQAGNLLKSCSRRLREKLRR